MMGAFEETLILIIAFLIALTVHESAHGWVANRLGDPTAKIQGRISLNPLRHLDIYGTILVPFLLIIMRSPIVFGWAKPVIFDPYNLKNPRKDSALISLAGPSSNFLIAILLSIILYGLSSLGNINLYIQLLLFATIRLNVILGVFNLIPIHPLDGGKIFIGLLPEDQAQEADMFLRRYGFIILIFLIFPFFGGTSPLFSVIGPVIDFFLNLLIPGNPLI